MNISTMAQMNIGERADIRTMSSSGGIRRRLRDLGLVEGITVECVARGPAGDPSAFLVCGAVIALRREDMEMITVDPAAVSHICSGAQQVLI